jgi:hypothetical protein
LHALPLQLISLVSAVGGVSAMLLLPCLLTLVLLWRSTSRHERVLCMILCTASLAITVLGVYTSIVQLQSGNEEDGQGGEGDDDNFLLA